MSELVLVNPRRRRRKRRTTTTRRAPARRTYARRNPVRRRRRTYRRRSVRRNPRMNMQTFMRDTLTPAIYGVGGGVALDVTMNMIPLPPQFKTGAIGTGTKMVGAVVLGNLLRGVMGRKRAEQMTMGAMIFILASPIRNMISQFVPGVTLSGSDFAYRPMDAYVPMSEYIPGGGGQLGYMNAGMNVTGQPSAYNAKRPAKSSFYM